MRIAWWAAAGGFGGLAPTLCQIAAILMSEVQPPVSLIGAGAAPLPPSINFSPPVLFFDLLVLVFFFAVGTIVAFHNVDSSDSLKVRKAFLVGTSVPALILGLANGKRPDPPALTPTLSINRQQARSQRESQTFSQYAFETPLFIRKVQFQSSSLGQMVQPTSNIIQVKFALKCIYCSFGQGPEEAIHAINVRSAEARDKQPSPSIVMISQQKNGSWIQIQLPEREMQLELFAPDRNTLNSPNPALISTDATKFEAVSGNKYVVTISLRPSMFDGVRWFLGRGALYVPSLDVQGAH